ncbi:pinensin family lanthipeptide [Luteibaculum oceani]|uniref:Uncharacterized protein n=1 Tax=Luteibaculum oceani TaxID=1294296 RepID=A0A5C6VKM3_9FLAO|nr:pinensin family lanthipeptide [Luteibaculum oceani]TXC85234.1 hypothetical protein FRX97_01015 [Luteibaculum oceani]
MKKKLKINDLKVKSFVTNLEASKMKSIKGQGSVSVNDETMYSCYAYVTCDIVYCATNGTIGPGNVTDNIAIGN